MAKTDKYFQFPIYLLDGDINQIRGWIIAHTAHKIGSKILNDGYDSVFDDAEAIERGCDELKTIEYTNTLVDSFNEASDKIESLTARYGTGNMCRVREDLFRDSMKRKPTITENYFRVFAAMTAVLGGSGFKRITRDRLHAGASGWKTSELPDGWTPRVKFGMMQKITAGLARKKMCASYWDNRSRRDTWYSIKMRPEELEGAVKNKKGLASEKPVPARNDSKPERKSYDVVADELHPYVKRHAEEVYSKLFGSVGVTKGFDRAWERLRGGSYGRSKKSISEHLIREFKDMLELMKRRGIKEWAADGTPIRCNSGETVTLSEDEPY